MCWLGQRESGTADRIRLSLDIAPWMVVRSGERGRLGDRGKASFG